MNAELLSLFAALVTFAWAAWCVFSKKVHDGLVGKAIYSLIALASFAILVGAQISGAPSLTLNLCLAALAVRHFMLRTIWPRVICKLYPKTFHHRRESDGI